MFGPSDPASVHPNYYYFIFFNNFSQKQVRVDKDPKIDAQKSPASST